MKRKKPRELRPDEVKLWNQVAETATPLEKSATKLRLSKPKETSISEKPAFRAKPFRLGSSAKKSPEKKDFSPTLGAVLESQPLRMDAKSFSKMKRGKVRPDAKIDLHGKTASAAHGALNAFVLRAHAEGKRLVLVITGKGRVVDDDSPIPTRTGVIRHQTPHWLSTPPLSQVVLQVTEAHQRHGGSGAFYVYLRRR